MRTATDWPTSRTRPTSIRTIPISCLARALPASFSGGTCFPPRRWTGRRLRWPACAGPADGGRRVETGGLANAYAIGFVFNGGWALNQPASFIVDNFRFIPRNPIDHADFNDDNVAQRVGLADSYRELEFADCEHVSRRAISDRIRRRRAFRRVSSTFRTLCGSRRFGTPTRAPERSGSFLPGLDVPEPSSLMLIVAGRRGNCDVQAAPRPRTVDSHCLLSRSLSTRIEHRFGAVGRYAVVWI